jgi:pimeloyl-ACP methyl ester carboxylesterase
MQIHSTFHPRGVPFGAFGGGSCWALRTPVIFLHGNGDVAGNWNAPSSDGGPSVLEHFRKAGYNDCELFGLTYLSPYEREMGGDNFHSPDKAKLIADFIVDVMRYTGKKRVDIVAHSFGATMALYSLDRANLWDHVGRIVSIAGGMRGLANCAVVGYANYFTRSCIAATLNPDEFGFWPDGLLGVKNSKIGTGPESYTRYPQKHPEVRFYTIRAGLNDQFICQGMIDRDGCKIVPTFADAPAVYSQVDVGAGRAAPTGFEPVWGFNYFAAGGDADGVGHLRSKTDTGALQVRMITSECRGLKCCDTYRGKCTLN